MPTPEDKRGAVADFLRTFFTPEVREQLKKDIKAAADKSPGLRAAGTAITQIIRAKTEKREITTDDLRAVVDAFDGPNAEPEWRTDDEPRCDYYGQVDGDCGLRRDHRGDCQPRLDK